MGHFDLRREKLYDHNCNNGGSISKVVVKVGGRGFGGGITLIQIRGGLLWKSMRIIIFVLIEKKDIEEREEMTISQTPALLRFSNEK